MRCAIGRAAYALVITAPPGDAAGIKRSFRPSTSDRGRIRPGGPSAVYRHALGGWTLRRRRTGWWATTQWEVVAPHSSACAASGTTTRLAPAAHATARRHHQSACPNWSEADLSEGAAAQTCAKSLCRALCRPVIRPPPRGGLSKASGTRRRDRSQRPQIAVLCAARAGQPPPSAGLVRAQQEHQQAIVWCTDHARPWAHPWAHPRPHARPLQEGCGRE